MKRYGLLKISIVFGVLLFLFASCPILAQKRNTAAKSYDKIVEPNLKFGFKLFSKIVRREYGKNIFISPPSAAIALAMANNSAAGKTRDEIAKALQLNDLTISEVNSAYSSLLNALKSQDKKVELLVANSLWGRKEIEFKPKFLTTNNKYYNAEIKSLDFSDPQSVSIINGWVSAKTKGLINQIIKKIDPSAILFIINAIYFKGIWSYKFDTSKTRKHPFHLLDGMTINVPMMFQSGKYPYFATEKFQAISLPYGDGRTSMYIFLPNKNSNLKEFLDSLNINNWKKWRYKFVRGKGNIGIPRFKLEYETKLNDVLQSLGIVSAFDAKSADFKNLSEACDRRKGPGCFISEVIQKTFLEVDEEGTRAAAVTEIGMALTSVNVSQPFSMTVDRPFFCAIVDNRTQTILFMGAIVRP